MSFNPQSRTLLGHDCLDEEDNPDKNPFEIFFFSDLFAFLTDILLNQIIGIHLY